MKKGFAIISIVALLVAVAGVIIAIAAYFKNKDFLSCCCDEDEEFMDFDDADLDYFSADMEEEDFSDDDVFEEPTEMFEDEILEETFVETTEPKLEKKK